MSEGLSDILYTGESETRNIAADDIRHVTLYEESGSNMVSVILGGDKHTMDETLGLFGKVVVVSGLLDKFKFKVVSVSYDRTVNSVTLLGSMLNT
jgi:hypothetical protein